MNLAAKRRVCLLTLTTLALAGVATALLWRQCTLRPKRFAAVVDERLYRSGALTPAQLERLQRDCRIGRVVSLLDADAPQTVAERAAARRLGIEWHNIPLRGNGASTPADRQRILQLLRVPDAPPTLVHCAAGVNRTGLAVGLYRLHVQGWTLDQVLAEMRRFDFENLPRHENLRQALAAEAKNARAETRAP